MGYRGVHVNKSAELNWQGDVPLSEFLINDDPNPEVIVKRLPQINHTQHVTVRYLKPPTPPPHGDLIIIQEADVIGPPIILRQHMMPSTSESAPTSPISRYR